MQLQKLRAVPQPQHGNQRPVMMTSYMYVSTLMSAQSATVEILAQPVTSEHTKLQPVPLLVLPVEQQRQQQEQDPTTSTIVVRDIALFECMQ